LDVTLLWLPKQCPELNPQDHLWKELKRLIVANRQFLTIDDEADQAEHWLLGMTSTTALRKAGILSDHFWLKDVL
jgi:transposase